MNSLKFKIKNHKSTIGVIGLGYVGLPLAIRFAEVGFKVIGFDIDERKVKMLNNGKSYIKHINEGDISGMGEQGFIATTDFEKISHVDAILICVPTPLGVHNEPDLSYVKSTLDLVKDHLREEQLLILESTTYPGTTAEEIVPVIEALGFKIGENFYIGYSPEREDPGNKNFSVQSIPKVVSGHTKNCLEVTRVLYDQIVDTTVSVSSTQVAEMTKILENIHRAVNIGLVNELKMVADKMNIDINEVINAAATKPFGFTAYYPGPGLGGHCIPIDPFYLTWKAKEMGVNTRFIELAGEINSAMPVYVVSKVTDALNTVEKSISGSRILILGLAYKKNIDDVRESPSLELIDLLLQKGALVDYSDPFISETHKTRKNDFNMKSVSLTKAVLNTFDLVLLATDHDGFDYGLIEKESKLIVDTRGKFNISKKVIKA